MKGERGFFFSVVSVGYCFAQAFPFDAHSLLHKMLQAPRAPGTSSPPSLLPNSRDLHPEGILGPALHGLSLNPS